MMNCRASDIERELEYADRLAESQPVGRVVRLGSGAHRFLGIYAETEREAKEGTAIILHDRGRYPDQRPLIHALRTILPKHRWATLALQMPVGTPYDDGEDAYALFSEVVSRIRAAADYLNQIGVGDLVLVGYGLGSLMALYAHNQLPDRFKAVVAISLPVPETENPSAQTLAFIEQADVPMLDLYATQDLSEVTDSALKRRLAAKQNQDYRQIRIMGAAHSYRHDEDLVVKRVYSWLRRFAVATRERSQGEEKLLDTE